MMKIQKPDNPATTIEELNRRIDLVAAVAERGFADLFARVEALEARSVL
jgi:hypothetical protein